jgi:DNA-binding beta-propeller fold protein YncE
MPPRRPLIALAIWLAAAAAGTAQVTTTGFPNVARPEPPGTLLSHPVANGSEPIGRTTSLNYLNGWLIVGGEAPGSRPGSDLVMRVYDLADPANPVRRFPSDFGLSYPENRWHQGNVGWGAHGTAQSSNLLLPNVVRVATFGGPVELGGTNGIPDLGQLPLGYSRSNQAGPWVASFPWYGSPDTTFELARAALGPSGYVTFQSLAQWDHVGPYGGGDWHPMIFGDLLIYARSGPAGRDGVVVYRLQFQGFDDADPANDTVTPAYVGSLAAGFQGYWPNLFSDGTGLYVIGSTTDILVAADLTEAAHPSGDGSVRLAASLTVPQFTNASYPVYQDHFGFIHNRKIDLTRFLAGDANPIALTLDEAGTGVDTSQMSLPLGNLWLTGGYPIPGRNQGMAVWVHQQAADTTPPRVTYHVPQANRTGYSRHAPLSFLLHEHPRHGGPRNGTDFTVRPVGPGNVLGAAVPGTLIHDFAGVLTFNPDGPLAADTTYQVDFLSDPVSGTGFADAAGNFIEPYSFRFSTGGGLDALPRPSFTGAGLTADDAQPAPGQTVSVTATATGAAPLEYRFNFDGVWSAWSASPSAAHAYASPGRPRVLAQVRDVHGGVANASLRLLVLTPPPPGPGPTRSSTIVSGDDPGGRRVWTVNPDSDTVAVLDATDGAKLAEHAVGQRPRGIARDGNGRYWVTCEGSDELRVLNPDGTSHAMVPLAYGSGPFGIAPSPDGESLFVSLQGSGHVLRFAADAPAAPPASQPTFPTPRALAVSPDGQRLFVTRFLSADLHAEIAEFAAAAPGFDPVRVIPLSSANPTDGGDRASGVPNYLTGIAVSPDGTRAAVVSKQDNVQRGVSFGVGDLTHETTVRSVISFLDLTTHAEIRHTRRDFDNSDSPSAVAYSPLGDLLLVTLQGNNTVVGIDALGLAPVPAPDTAGSTETSPAVITLELGTGLAPQGLWLDPEANRLVTQDFMGRTVTVRDAGPWLDQNLTSLPLVASTETVAVEPLSPQVLQGKRIFYNAADPRMSADSYLSCATCHLDGGHDGRVWDFAGRGEGLRRTTDLRGRSGVGHGNVHWSGNFDEIQDFEHDIRGPFGGTGFLDLSPTAFATLHPGPATGKTGLSADLDALAAYVTSLGPDHVPRSPHRAPDGTFPAAATRGQAVFAAQGCASCHPAPGFTDSAVQPVDAIPLGNPGTLSALSGARLGQPLPGIDTPTLHGLHASRVFLHHGLAPELEDVFRQAGGELRFAAQATFLGTSVQAFADSPAQGGGGFYRGAFGGSSATLAEGPGAPGVRFEGIDGGVAGGMARISVRYVRQYSGGTATVTVNGVPHPVTTLRQEPDNGWQTSGWRWLTLDLPLQPGPVNTVDILRGNGDLQVNVLLVASADILAQAQPHHLVESLSAGDRADLLAYLLALDGRDAAGTPLPPPAPPGPLPPAIVSAPGPVTLAEGNPLSLSVTVSGTGPFTFAWTRDGTPVGSDSPIFHVPASQPADAGAYRVSVTNAQGFVQSDPATVTVNPPLSVTTSSLPAAALGDSYTFDLAAAGGVSARTWSLDSGFLPPGLTLSAQGQLSGTPTVAARASLTVRVTDSSGSATRSLQLDAVPPGGFDPDPDLVLHYRFDEGSGTRVWDTATGGNNHATTVPGAHWIPDGRFGGAYGPSALDSPLATFTPADQADLDFDPRGDDFTVSLWYRTTAGSGYHTLIGKDGGTPYRVQLRLWNVVPATHLQAVTGDQYGGVLATSPPLNDGEWHLVTLVNFLDGATWRTRVHHDDGTASTVFDSGPAPTVSALLRVGGFSAGWNEWLGQIDDLRIYRRALTPAEIAALHAPPGSPTVTLARAPGQEEASSRPFAEFDVTFSRPVSGLTADDFRVDGIGASARHLVTLEDGTRFRLRLAGFPGPGSLTLSLPAGRAAAVDDGVSTLAAGPVSVTLTVPVGPGRTYEEWLADRLPPADLVRPDRTDPEADPDGNGVTHLAAFAFGSDSPSPLALEITGPPQAPLARITAARNPDARGVTWVVEHASGFSGPWTPLASSTDGAAPAAHGGATVTDGTEATPPRLVRIELPVDPGVPRHLYRARAQAVPP